MNKGMLTVGIIILAVIALLLVNVLNNFRTGSELDYYLVKETTDAALIDAVDVEYYRMNGLYRIDKEKFAESFLRRFADGVDLTRNYKVNFYDINEVPPKVSVKIDSLTVLSFSGEQHPLSTAYNSIVEAGYIGDPSTESRLNNPKDEVGMGE